jgi:LysR family glycine cleavage system transcriptional activator
MLLTISRLPSLDLIRGFVAVGRRMSITLAAEDLCVTQSAVSRQVRTLEELVGVKLLKRGHRSIAFTLEGERLFRIANGVVEQLQEAVGALGDRGQRRPVTITCSIGMAGLWLLPRLGAFQSAYPGIDVRIAASERIEDLRGGSIDLAIRYCAGENAPEGAERLFEETVAPVVSPALGLSSLESPQALERHFLLEYDGANLPWLHWREWLGAQGWDAAKPKGMLRFNQYDQVIGAAAAGHGIALGRPRLLGNMIAEGRLRVLDTPRAGPPISHAYWLIKARPSPRSDVLTVADWIRSQAQTDGSTLPSPAPHTPIAPVAEKRRREPGRKTRPARSARDGGPNIVE